MSPASFGEWPEPGFDNTFCARDVFGTDNHKTFLGGIIRYNINLEYTLNSEKTSAGGAAA